MKLIFLLLIYLLSFPADAGLLFRQADSLYNAGKLDEAMEVAVTAADRARELSDTTSLIKALCIQASVAIDQGNDMEAVDYYNKCADLFPFSEPMFMLSSSLYNIASIYYQNGEYDKAEEYITKSINIDSRRSWDSILALRYLLAAEISYENGDYTKSMEFVEGGLQCLKNRRSRNIEGRLMFINVKCKEALSGPDKDWNSLEEEYRDAFQTMTTKCPEVFYGAVNPYTPELLYRLGLTVAAQGRDASDYFQKAIDNSRMSQTMLGINPLIEMKCCKAMAEILLKNGDNAGAEKYLDRAEALSYVPYVSGMSIKLALSQMEFIRREKDREIEAKRAQALHLALVVSILSLLLACILLMLRHQIRQRKQIEEKNGQLVKLGLQKDQLIDMLKSSNASSSERASLEEIESDKVPLPDIKLSKREVEVLELCCKGMTNKEVASQLNLSVRTVETHKLNICSKAGVKSTPELIAFAFKSGLIR